MANCIARAVGYDQGRRKETTRLGSKGAEAQANTWRTFTTCSISLNGAGYVQVIRDGVVIHRFDFGQEGSGATQDGDDRRSTSDDV